MHKPIAITKKQFKQIIYGYIKIQKMYQSNK